MNENLILQNYSDFLQENTELFEESATASTIITDSMTYDSYTNKLLEGIEESSARTIRDMFDRQRDVLLEESSSLMGTSEGITYAVASFPMLVDLYADPLLSKVVSVYPSTVPTMSIPRLKWVSKIIDIKGNTTEFEFPNAEKSIRVGFETVTMGQYGNVFDIALGDDLKTTKSEFRLNKRNFKMTSVTVVIDGTDTNVPVIAVADARGHFVAEDVEVGGLSVDGILFKVAGQINFETGDVTWNVINLEGSTVAVTAKEATLRMRIQGVGNAKGVVKARPKQDVLDINCDIEDSFEIENIEEVIQDWKSLYNLDIMSQLKNYVKDQIKLNRDFEIAEILESNIPVCKQNGLYREVDFSSVASATDTKPSTVMDIFRNLVPVLVSLIESLRKKTRMEVKYLVTGIDGAAILKSLQSFAVSIDKMEGTVGQSGDTVGSFNKLEVISSFAVGDDYIYLIPKAESLSQSTLVEISHKPLYVIVETTNSIKRTFIKCRNWIGLVRNEAVATVHLKGYEAALGQS